MAKDFIIRKTGESLPGSLNVSGFETLGKVFFGVAKGEDFGTKVQKAVKAEYPNATGALGLKKTSLENPDGYQAYSANAIKANSTSMYPGMGGSAPHF